MTGETSYPQQRNFLQLLWGIIARPRATFQHLNQEGRRLWWLMALLTAVLVILPLIVGAPIAARQAREAVMAVTGFQVGVVRQEEPGVRGRVEPAQELTPEQQQQMEQAMRYASSPLVITVFPAIGRVAGLIVGWLAWAGFLYLSGMVVGGHARFGDLFRMVVWAWVPYALRGLLQTLYILASGQLITNPGLSGLVAVHRTASEGMMAPPSAGQIIASSILSRIDIFLFWNLALLVIGTVVVGRISGRKATALVLGIWLVLTLLGLLPALVGLLVSRSFGM